MCPLHGGGFCRVLIAVPRVRSVDSAHAVSLLSDAHSFRAAQWHSLTARSTAHSPPNTHSDARAHHPHITGGMRSLCQLLVSAAQHRFLRAVKLANSLSLTQCFCQNKYEQNWREAKADNPKIGWSGDREREGEMEKRRSEKRENQRQKRKRGCG
jgi:hypothetical protein